MREKIIYEPHPVSPDRKAELRNQGYTIVDERFKPEEVGASALDIAEAEKQVAALQKKADVAAKKADASKKPEDLAKANEAQSALVEAQAVLDALKVGE